SRHVGGCGLLRQRSQTQRGQSDQRFGGNAALASLGRGASGVLLEFTGATRATERPARHRQDGIYTPAGWRAGDQWLHVGSERLSAPPVGATVHQLAYQLRWDDPQR